MLIATAVSASKPSRRHKQQQHGHHGQDFLLEIFQRAAECEHEADDRDHPFAALLRRIRQPIHRLPQRACLVHDRERPARQEHEEHDVLRVSQTLGDLHEGSRTAPPGCAFDRVVGAGRRPPSGASPGLLCRSYSPAGTTHVRAAASSTPPTSSTSACGNRNWKRIAVKTAVYSFSRPYLRRICFSSSCGKCRHVVSVAPRSSARRRPAR